MRGLICGAALLALAACGGEETEPATANVANEAEPTLTPGPMLGEVDLSKPVSAEGVSWTLDLTPGTIFYTTPGVPADAPGQLYFVAPEVSDGTAVYRTQNLDGDTSMLTLAAELCGRDELPLTAELRIGERSYEGCAKQAAERDPEPAPSPSPVASEPPAPGN